MRASPMCRASIASMLASLTAAFVFPLAVLSPVSRADEPTPEKVKASLKGKWVATEQFTNGKAVPKDEWVQLSWEFTGDQVVIEMADYKGRKMSPLSYTFSLDPSKDPAYLDVSSKHPKIGFIGIYKLEKDTLTICWNAGREDRPKKFETTKNDFAWMLMLKQK